MDEELQYLRGFFEWMQKDYDKFYRLHEEFNERYAGEIPEKYKTE